MEESTYHEMVIHLSQRFCIMLCLFIYFLHFFISFKYDFHIGAERMIVKTRDMYRNICVDGLKNMYGTIPLPYGRIADMCRLQSTKLIFLGYGQLNSTTVLEFLNRHV